MTQWIRRYWAEGDEVSYFEMDDEGWAVRQVVLQSAERRPVIAAKLSEVLRIRDHGTIADMQAYEHRYGVLAEDDLRGWRDDDNVVVISGAEFEQVWAAHGKSLITSRSAAASPPSRHPLVPQRV